nr:MAG TPA: hypothetical protein [Bacteriophage sp.]
MELQNQERKAVKTALELLGYYDVAESEDTIQEWLADDTISICTCRSGRTAACIITDCKEACVYVDTLEQLTDVQIERELL